MMPNNLKTSVSFSKEKTVTLRHGSLFSGIGGFDLAAEWVGWSNIFHCEWNNFGQRVLKHYWPKAKSYEDITQTDFTIHRGSIDILTGGFPCQPYSSAGKRLGKEDDRHLWPEMLRAAREILPRWVVGENVRGLVNWSGGLVFDEVQADLEAEGYEVQPFLLPACAVNAPHRRDRIWFVAYSDESRQGHYNGGANSEKERDLRGRNTGHVSKPLRRDGPTPNADGIRGRNKNDGQRQGTKKCASNHKADFWQDFPTVAPILSGNDGFPDKLDGITFPGWRNESIKAAGNAIVPQVAFQIFKAIAQFEKEKKEV